MTILLYGIQFLNISSKAFKSTMNQFFACFYHLFGNLLIFHDWTVMCGVSTIRSITHIFLIIGLVVRGVSTV